MTSKANYALCASVARRHAQAHIHNVLAVVKSPPHKRRLTAAYNGRLRYRLALRGLLAALQAEGTVDRYIRVQLASHDTRHPYRVARPKV